MSRVLLTDLSGRLLIVSYSMYDRTRTNGWLVVERLYESAHELANLANRSGPIVTDLLLACKGEGLEIEQLRKMTALNKKVKKRKQGIGIVSV